MKHINQTLVYIHAIKNDDHMSTNTEAAVKETSLSFSSFHT